MRSRQLFDIRFVSRPDCQRLPDRVTNLRFAAVQIPRNKLVEFPRDITFWNAPRPQGGSRT